MNKYVVALIGALIGFYFVCPPALDLIRYYDTAETISTNQSLLDFSLDTFHKNFDFIYFSLFHLVKNIGFYKECVTALFMGIFYSQIIYFLELSEKKIFRIKRKTDRILINTFAVFSVTPIYVITISRNAAALSILFIGLCYLIKEKKIGAYFCFIFSLFTHVGVFIYLLGTYLFYNFKIFHIGNIKIRNTLLIISTVVGLNSKNWIYSVFGLFSKLSFFSSYERYAGYLSQDNSNDGALFDVLSYGDTIPIIYNTIILLIGLILIKKYINPILWVAYFYYIFLVVSIGFSCMWVERVIIFLMPFQGAVALAILSQNQGDKIFCMIYKALLFISIVMCFLNLYTYREILYLSF